VFVFLALITPSLLKRMGSLRQKSSAETSHA